MDKEGLGEKLSEQNAMQDGSNTKEKYDELCIHLLKKWGDGSTGTGTGIRVTLRLPNGTKVRAVVDENCTAKTGILQRIAWTRKVTMTV
ncbi:uncharacterized protein [Dysidea avara]|uniref:uncharacterized protein isoform X2 n=1 Tax=Dysidea avara TaxID=196820 RepID=UPI00332027E8